MPFEVKIDNSVTNVDQPNFDYKIVSAEREEQIIQKE